MKTWPIIAAGALLTACGNPANDDRGTPPPAGNSQGYLAKVTKLPEGQLRGVLYRAIIDGGVTSCSQVKTATRAPDQNGRAVWTAGCADGSRWTIAIGDDGIAQARPAAKAG